MKFISAFVSLGIMVATTLSGCAETPTSKPTPGSTALMASSAPSAAVASGAPVVIPIHAMMIGYKLIYYITVQVGDAQETKALLDTGSVGLRVAEGDVPVTSGGRQSTYGYSSGVMLEGNLQHHDVRLGDFVARRITIDKVHKLYCSDKHPDCNVAKLGPGSYFIRGVDGISSSDVSAIIGIGLNKGRDAPNPLIDAGFKRWIVSLPRSVADTGSLTLNPTADQGSGFYTTPVDRDGRYKICISASSTTSCAPGTLDTGAPHIGLWIAQTEIQIFPSGEWVQMTFGPPGLLTPSLRFQSGTRGQTSAIYVQPLTQIGWREPHINAGVTPFLYFDVLYDANKKGIGLRPRK